MIETVGKFKLKDKLNRRTVKINFPNGDTGRLIGVLIEKVFGTNNEFVVALEWNFKERIPNIIEPESSDRAKVSKKAK